MESIQVKTSSRMQFIDITSRVKEAISKSGIKEGIAVVYVAHITAGVTINESADPAVAHDMVDKLARLIPLHDSYKHSEGNSDAHIKTSLVGSSVNLIISGGSPVLGTWQGIFFCEFDGPRTRKAFVKVVGE
jgi:secondary thiamine-phosphate synthase enzyme